MAKKVVNLTAPTIVEEIESVLETYPDHPYQRAFAIPDLRQELIAYVLNRISSCYVAVDESKPPAIESNSIPAPETSECMEVLIYQGIRQILNENEDLVSHQIPEETDPCFSPSHWFG